MESEDSIDHVDRNGVDRVVDFPSDQELRAGQVQRTRDQSDDDAGPALHDGTSCGDCYQSTQTSIHLSRNHKKDERCVSIVLIIQLT